MARLLSAALILPTVVGCSTAKAKPRAKKTSAAAPPTEVGTVNLDPGNSTHYGPEPKREPEWYVNWTTGAHADLSKATRSGDKGSAHEGRIQIDQVKMEGVTGHMFDKRGNPGSTFRSNAGIGDGPRQQLELAGDVHVVSPDLKSELTCDRLVYDAAQKVLRATGHVRVTGKVGTIGTLEIWATPDLKYVATPDMFSPPKAPAAPHR